MSYNWLQFWFLVFQAHVTVPLYCIHKINEPLVANFWRLPIFFYFSELECTNCLYLSLLGILNFWLYDFSNIG